MKRQEVCDKDRRGKNYKARGKNMGAWGPNSI